MINKVKLNKKEKQFVLERSKYTYKALQSMGIIKYGHENEVLDLDDSLYRLYKYSLKESTNGSIDLSTAGAVYYTRKLKEASQKVGKIANCSTDIQLRYTKSFIHLKIVFSSNEPGVGGIGQLPLQINKVDYDMCQV